MIITRCKSSTALTGVTAVPVLGLCSITTTALHFPSLRGVHNLLHLSDLVLFRLVNGLTSIDIQPPFEDVMLHRQLLLAGHVLSVQGQEITANLREHDV